MKVVAVTVVNVGNDELVPSTILPPEDTISLELVKAVEEFVPPLAIGTIPVIDPVMLVANKFIAISG